MIIEWLTAKFTPASPLARLLGYVDSSIALSHRHKRCRKAWEPHLQISRAVILAERPTSAKKILIIGSGHLLDIPLDEFIQDSQVEVTLVDFVHPLGVRKKVKKLKDRVQLIELDVTGAAPLLTGQEGLKQVAALKFAPPLASNFGQNFDYVVSANIISQLPLDPYNRLTKVKSDLVSDEFFVRLSKHMGDQHIEWLQGLGHKVLLLSDVTRTYFDKQGQETERVESAYVTRAGKLIKSWDWLISPLGETDNKFSYNMQIEARILKQ